MLESHIYMYSIFHRFSPRPTCRDHAASALFEDEAAEDQPIPVCILDALMKVSERQA